MKRARDDAVERFLDLDARVDDDEDEEDEGDDNGAPLSI
jgi:hypothetical protein